MGRKAKTPPPAQPEPPAQSPPQDDCGCEPGMPGVPGIDGSLGLDLTGLLGGVSSALSLLGQGAQVSLNVGAASSEDETCTEDGGSGSSSGSSSVAINVGVPDSDSGAALISLDSETDGQIHVPLFGAEGALGGGVEIGNVIGSGGEGGDGRALVSLDGETDALVSVPIFAGDGGIAPAGDVGSLLNSAMLNVGNVGGLGALAGGEAYDGNVPLVGDLASALGSTLDLLTTTSSLFDVPALDILSSDGLDG